VSDSKPCKQCGDTMTRQSGHSDYGWDMKEFCDTNCRVRYSQANRQRQPRCKYCGAMLPEPTKRDGGRHGQKFCDRFCYQDYLVAEPEEYEHAEPSEEQKAEWESRREEIWQRNFGHLQRCDAD